MKHLTSQDPAPGLRVKMETKITSCGITCQTSDTHDKSVLTSQYHIQLLVNEYSDARLSLRDSKIAWITERR